MIRFLYLLLLLPSLLTASGITYTVVFEGLDDPDVLHTIESVSQLSSLVKKPPASMNALRYRADSDIPQILQVLQAYGYYEASVQVRVEEFWHEGQVIVSINPGPVYILQDFHIDLYNNGPGDTVKCKKVKLKNIGISLGKPVMARNILEGEQKLLLLLSECGYPLAQIENREIIADGATKTLRVRLDVKTGRYSFFGATAVSGLKTVKPNYILHKKAWKKGQAYDSHNVEATQQALIDTGLFRSVLITHGEKVDDYARLPMRIEVAETKHKTVHIGASYQTFFGPGISFGWENRNIDGMGRKLSFQGDVTRKTHSGIAALTMPDFRVIGQDVVFQAQAMHESIRAFSERSYSVLGRLERKFGKRLRLGFSGKIEKLYVTSSVDNGTFTLLQAPLYLRWSSADSLLNPTKGLTFEYLGLPATNLEHNFRGFFLQKIIQSSYWPVIKKDRLVLAQKITLGLILSDRLSHVPVPYRFFGGSEEDLRGYHYFTVSPLKDHEKPIGGRSALFYTFETRFRISESLGLVPFFDMGNVWLTQLPTFNKKWFKSVGLGIRYFSYIGPLRIDVGFPLERRKEIDRACRVLVSIGQMF